MQPTGMTLGDKAPVGKINISDAKFAAMSYKDSKSMAWKII